VLYILCVYIVCDVCSYRKSILAGRGRAAESHDAKTGAQTNDVPHRWYIYCGYFHIFFSPTPSSSTTRSTVVVVDRTDSTSYTHVYCSILIPLYIIYIYITCVVYSYVLTLDAILSSANPSPAPGLQRTSCNIICEYFVVIVLHYRGIWYFFLNRNCRRVPNNIYVFKRVEPRSFRPPSINYIIIIMCVESINYKRRSTILLS